MNIKFLTWFCFFCIVLLTIIPSCGGEKKVTQTSILKENSSIKIPPHEENWAFYLSTVDSSKASILLDLGLKNILPIDGSNYLAFVTLDLLQSGENGLGTKEEFEKLQDIESSLELSLTASNKSIYAGRITTNGQREFYYYTADTINFENICLNVVEDFKNYSFRIGFRSDSDWEIYQNVLYPNPEAMQSIQNARGIENLVNNGDALKSKRKISHWIYFRTEINRASFEKEISKNGYRTEELFSDESDTTFPFVIEISRNDLVNYESIDSLVLPLFRLAKKHDGDYDGWETKIEKK